MKKRNKSITDSKDRKSIQEAFKNKLKKTVKFGVSVKSPNKEGESDEREN